MIVFDHVCKAFNGKVVLDNISGRFKPGETSLVIGKSGSGKSVFLKCLVGLIHPEKGTITFNDRDIFASDHATIIGIKREIGMLFQGGALFDSKTVEENVMFPLDMLTDMPKSEKADRVNFCLKRVGLGDAHKKLINELSGGMQKRVGIARAIVFGNPKYLLCDEPNSGLDPQTSLLIDELIRELTQEYNITTIVVTHNLDSIFTLGDHVIFLHQSKKVWEGRSQDLFQVDLEPLNDFLFASTLMRDLKKIHA